MWNGSGSNVDISQPPSGWGPASVWMAWRIILVMLLKHNTNHFANPLHWALNTARCHSSQAWERQPCTCAKGSRSFVLLPSVLYLLSRDITESLHEKLCCNKLKVKHLQSASTAEQTQLQTFLLFLQKKYIFQTNMNFCTFFFFYTVTDRYWHSCWTYTDT